MSEFSDTNPPDTGGGWDPYTEVPPVSLSDTVEASPGGGISDDPAPDAEGGWDITAHPETGEEAPEAAAHAETTPPDITPADEGARPVAVTQVHERERVDDTNEVTSNREQVDERSYLFTDTPGVTRQEVIDQRDKWEAGEPVHSEVHAVGLIQPTDEEIAIITDPAVGAYMTPRAGKPLRERTEALRESLARVATADAERNGMAGALSTNATVGHFVSGNREPFHSENLAGPSLFWTVAFGVGSTVGARGMVSQADTDHVGNLVDQTVVGPGKQLEEVRFPEGTVVRIKGQGDIHAGPEGTGRRIFVTATLRQLIDLGEFERGMA